MMKIRLLAAFILLMSYSVVTAQNRSSRMFNLDKKVVYKTKGAGAEKLRDMLIDFFSDVHVEARKRNSNANDTIFITQYPSTKKGADYSVDIYRHSVEIRYKGEENRQKAFEALVAKFNKMTGNKKIPRHTLVDTVDYNNRIDLTNANMNLSELRENLDWASNNGVKTLYLKLYSPDGIVLTSPSYQLFAPKESLSKVEMCSAVELHHLLKEYAKKIKFVFVLDFREDEKSFFKEVMGYHALSDEGCRVLKSFVKELSVLAPVGTFEVQCDRNDLKLKCYIEPLFKNIDATKLKYLY